MIFSGRKVPPLEKYSEDEIIKVVSDNPNAIGYVSTDAVKDLDNVKKVEVIY